MRHRERRETDEIITHKSEVINPATPQPPQTDHASRITPHVTFKVSSYDPAHPLIIDPVLVYSTFLGGSTAAPGSGIVGDPNYEAANDQAYGIAVDAAGSVYVTGETLSGDFPTANPMQAAHGGGARDAFVIKINAAGNAIVYSTYLGGSEGEYGFGIAVDSSGIAYVAGDSPSTNFPVTVGAFQITNRGSADAIVAKLDANGSLLYSTYLGGSSNEVHYGGGIAVDTSGNIYVAGHTASSNFPTTPGAFDRTHNGNYDAFVAKIDPTKSGSASLVYSTFLGGSGKDDAYSIALNSSGSA